MDNKDEADLNPSSCIVSPESSPNSATSHGNFPSMLTYKPMAVQPPHHRLAANVLQGNLARACVVVQEMRIRGKGFKWLKDLKENILKDIVSLWQQDEEKCQDRELKEFKMGEFVCPVGEEEVMDAEARKLIRVVKVGGIKLPGLDSSSRVKQ